MKASRAASDRATAERVEPLLERARVGDNAALAELLAVVRPLMFHVAHQRATPTMPADDLVATATLRFIETLAKGGGPTRNPGAYLTASIRNLAVDHSKLRETANISLDASVGERLLEESPQESSSIELLIERSAVRAAFARLKPEQRKVLHETAVDGRTPADIADEQGQRANTVSAQASRARAALAVELRSVLLTRLGTEACEPFRAELARNGVARSLEAREHLEGCARCRRALASFTAIPAVLATLPFVITGGGAVAAAAAGSGAAGIVHASATKALFASPAGRGVAVLLGGGVVAAAVAGGLGLAQRDPVVMESPIAMHVATVEGAGSTDITVTVEPQADIDAPAMLSLELPDSMQVSSSPAGWACSNVAGGSTCELPAGSSTGVLSVETIDGGMASGTYSLSVSAASGSLAVVGSAGGSITVR